MSVDFNSLTAKQKKVYASIESFIKSKGIPPTVREIGEMIGEKTPGAVQGILNRLEQKGVIKREVGMARSIKLVQDNSNYPDPVYIPEIKRISKRNISNILDVYNVVKYQPFPADFLDSDDDCFMIQCPDNSLKDIGITYDDMLVFKRNFILEDGDIVLVLFESHSLMRTYHNSPIKDSVILKAQSNLLGREEFGKNEVVIVGKLIGKYTRI
ncbi:MAG: S24 family peptidase [Bacillota bacterium]|nr:S24 family peptidase [Bacillota bacterium]